MIVNALLKKGIGVNNGIPFTRSHKRLLNSSLKQHITAIMQNVICVIVTILS